MLKLRLNCFLGRMNGFVDLKEFDGLLEWPPIGPQGEPFRSAAPPILPKGLLGRAPRMDGDGLSADDGRSFCGGESMKHSPIDIEVVVDNLLLPAPRRKGGRWVSPVRGIELVEYPLVRFKEGRRRMDLRRLSL